MQGSDVIEGWLPDWLPAVSSATVDLDGEPPYSFHLDADAVLAAPHTDAWIDTEGRMETTPDGFESTGSLAFRPPEPRGDGGGYRVEVEAEDDGHVARGCHAFPAEGVWRSQETAERAAANAVEGFADSVDVEAEVETQTYTRDGDEVEVGYSAELAGVDRGATETLYQWFGSSREVEGTDLEIDRVSLEKATDGGETSYSWDVEVDGHLSLAADLADAAGWSRARELEELRRDTGFGVEAAWSIYMGDTVDLSLEYDAVNGRSYVDALRSASFEPPPESELHVDVDTTGGSRSTELRYTSESDPSELEASSRHLERWMTMVPAPLLPAASYYLSR